MTGQDRAVAASGDQTRLWACAVRRPGRALSVLRGVRVLWKGGAGVHGAPVPVGLGHPWVQGCQQSWRACRCREKHTPGVAGPRR